MKHERMTVAALLEHEAEFPRHSGRKERAIRKRFGVGPARYYQALNSAVLDQQQTALQLDPATTHRVLDQQQRTSADLRPRRAAGINDDRSTR